MPTPKKTAPPKSKPHEPPPARIYPPLKPPPKPKPVLPPAAVPEPKPEPEPELKPGPQPKLPEPEPAYQPVAMRHRMYGRKWARSEAEFLYALREGWTREQ